VKLYYAKYNNSLFMCFCVAAFIEAENFALISLNLKSIWLISQHG